MTTGGRDHRSCERHSVRWRQWTWWLGTGRVTCRLVRAPARREVKCKGYLKVTVFIIVPGRTFRSGCRQLLLCSEQNQFSFRCVLLLCLSRRNNFRRGEITGWHVRAVSDDVLGVAIEQRNHMEGKCFMCSTEHSGCEFPLDLCFNIRQFSHFSTLL